LEEVHEWCKECLLRIDVVVENPRPVFEVALKRSTELLTPKVWWTWFWNPARSTASRYHAPLSVSGVSETPCSQSTEKPERVLCCPREWGKHPTRQMGCLVYASTATHTYSGWPPTLYHAFIHRGRSVPALHWLEAKLCLNLFHPILNARLGKRLGEKPEESRGFSEAQPKRVE
jgi:hypothetical protein